MEAYMKGRFAPSPTGYIHLGNVWIALLSYISTRQQHGTYVIRMEDIDLQRSKRTWGNDVLDDLEWLGFDWDEGPRVGGPLNSYWQSERQEYYESVLSSFALDKLIYPCFCNRTRLQSISSAPHLDEIVHRYDGHCRYLSALDVDILRSKKAPSWRLAVESSSMEFTDLYQGQQHVSLIGGLDDYVLKRSDGMYAYNLAVVLDDIAMGVTEIIRGDDLLEATGQQLYLYKVLNHWCQKHHDSPTDGIHTDQFMSRLHSLGLQDKHLCMSIPTYGHAPLLIDRDGHRLSKRQKSITIRELREHKWSAKRILGELAIMGGLVDDSKLINREISLSDLVEVDLHSESLCRKTITIDTVMLAKDI